MKDSLEDKIILGLARAEISRDPSSFSGVYVSFRIQLNSMTENTVATRELHAALTAASARLVEHQLCISKEEQHRAKDLLALGEAMKTVVRFLQ